MLVHSAEVGDAFRPVSLPHSIYYAANSVLNVFLCLMSALVISISYVAYEVKRTFQFAYQHSHDLTFSRYFVLAHLAVVVTSPLSVSASADHSIIASKTFVFEVVSSLFLPAVAIHGAVHSTEAIIHHIFPHETISFVNKKDLPSIKFPQLARNYGPTAVGLLCIPFLPLVRPPSFFSVPWIMTCRYLTAQLSKSWTKSMIRFVLLLSALARSVLKPLHGLSSFPLT
jgi:hypothetical protein